MFKRCQIVECTKTTDSLDPNSYRSRKTAPGFQPYETKDKIKTGTKGMVINPEPTVYGEILVLFGRKTRCVPSSNLKSVLDENDQIIIVEEKSED